MSKKLEKIINSPQGNDALRKGIIELHSKKESNFETIEVSDRKYIIQFVGREPECIEE